MSKQYFQNFQSLHIKCVECGHVTFIRPGKYGPDNPIENECKCTQEPINKTKRKRNEKNKTSEDKQ